jgi:hypothetical protein
VRVRTFLPIVRAERGLLFLVSHHVERFPVMDGFLLDPSLMDPFPIYIESAFEFTRAGKLPPKVGP